MHHTLKRHPDSRGFVGSRVELDVTRSHANHLTVSYIVTGEMRDIAMPQAGQVIDGEFGRSFVVEDDVRHPFLLFRTGNRYGGKVAIRLERRIDRNDAVDSALGEHGLRVLNDFAAVVMTDEVVEVSGLQQTLLEAGEHKGRVSLGDLGNQDADSVRSAAAEGSRQQVGPVVQLACC